MYRPLVDSHAEPPPDSHLVREPSGIPSPVEPVDVHSPSRHLTATTWGTPKQEPPSWAPLDSWPPLDHNQNMMAVLHHSIFEPGVGEMFWRVGVIKWMSFITAWHFFPLILMLTVWFCVGNTILKSCSSGGVCPTPQPLEIGNDCGYKFDTPPHGIPSSYSV